MKLKKILYIDDEDDLRALFKMYFSDHNFTFLEAPNGKEGVEVAIEHIPDLIIMDYFMPIMSGHAAIKELKKNPKTKHIPIVLYTAFLSVLEEDELKEMDAVEYIKKPQTLDFLYKKISKYLD